ncbi:MAG: hypothetical protein QOJ99_3526 [Bryobacterales bacterium]|jgi:hypothetical protein|nr:hypothetical protein [Bryobacterales bacterium]
MSLEEWETHLEKQVNAAIRALLACGEKERELILEELNSNIRYLCEALRNGTVHTNNAGGANTPPM